MATNSSILAWKNPMTEEPDMLLFMGLQRVGQDLAVYSYFFHMSGKGICGQRCYLILLYIYISLKKKAQIDCVINVSPIKLFNLEKQRIKRHTTRKFHCSDASAS